MNSENFIHDLNIVKDYFSHNMRTSTAMVVAAVSIFKFGLSDDTDNMTDMIIESSYFLDVYDKGMEVLFNYVLGLPVGQDREVFDPAKITSKVIEGLQCSIAEQNINVSTVFNDMNKITTNIYVVKTILELIICEEIRKCTSSLSFYSKGNIFTITKSNPMDAPEIYKLFSRFLAELNIELTYTNDSVNLRFA